MAADLRVVGCSAATTAGTSSTSTDTTPATVAVAPDQSVADVLGEDNAIHTANATGDVVDITLSGGLGHQRARPCSQDRHKFAR